ncbi:MAG TPA: hypothetical protein VIH76_18550 [Candidatus Acidoferrales bacterium]
MAILRGWKRAYDGIFQRGKSTYRRLQCGRCGLRSKTLPHYIENLGDPDLIFLEMFKADRFMDLSLSEWIRNTPPELVMQHIGISAATLEKIPAKKAVIT